MGEEVNDQKSGGAGENRRDNEHSAPHQGGDVSAEQASEQAAPESCDAFDSGNEGAKKVTAVEGGAPRNSFFKRRDYDS